MGFGMVFVAAVLGAALFWLVLVRRSRLQDASGSEDRRAEHARLAKIAALLLTGLGVGFFLIFAVAELAGGDISGIQHLPPAALLGALLWLGWKRPRTAGIIVLLALALPLTVAFVVGIASEDARTGEMWFATLIPLVPVLTGLLFLSAGRHRRGQSCRVRRGRFPSRVRVGGGRQPDGGSTRCATGDRQRAPVIGAYLVIATVIGLIRG